MLNLFSHQNYHIFLRNFLKDIANTLSYITIGAYRTNSGDLVSLRKMAINEQNLAEVEISTPQRPGTRAKWESF